MKMISLIICLLILCIKTIELVQVTPKNSSVCRDEEGNPVDWFYVYKLPRIPGHHNKLVDFGTAYIYLTPDEIDKGWTLSLKSINSSVSMPGWTLSNLYDTDSETLSIIYNDESPEFSSKDSPNFSGGHTKGVVMGDIVSGLWLVHSVPKYPPLPTEHSYGYPWTGMRFGQSMLCLSVTAKILNELGQQLWYNEPLIRYSSLPSSLHIKYENLLSLVEEKTSVKAPWYRTEDFSTELGMQFVSFAKSSDFHQDLYSGLVAPELKANLLVETWRNGPENLMANCTSRYQVVDVEEINISQANITFSSHQDHSKWCSSAAEQKMYWICVGDINRAIPQQKRGGGTVCTPNMKIWKHFSDLIESSESCTPTAVLV